MEVARADLMSLTEAIYAANVYLSDVAPCKLGLTVP